MNDPLHICPRCGEKDCTHDERIIANALALVGTGVMNLDLCGQYRWVASLRRYSRTAIIELKPSGDGEIPTGQFISLLDLTGELKTSSGWAFEQRAFVIQRNGNGFTISSFWRRGTVNDPPKLWPILKDASSTDCATVIADWLRTGLVTWEV